MSIKNGDRVRVHYKGSLTDGETFDSSYERGAPLEFTVGGGELIAGVNDAVIGMAVGEKKTVEIAPENGYGPRNDEMVVRVQTSQLPEGATIGTMLQIETPEGAVQVVLSAIDGDEAELDGNHPLAGKTMVFDLEIVEIVQPE